MRYLAASVVPLLLVAGVAHGDSADGSGVAGTYAVQFEEVQNSCSGTGIGLRKLEVIIEQGKERAVSLTIPGIPVLKGKTAKEGKFQAKAARGKTAIEGLEGGFSAAGQVNGGALAKLVLIAEYYKAGKPFCTQSWNATGERK